MKNRNYWQEYYKTHERQEPSEFARWCVPRLQGWWVYDFGCGDGRDVEFLRSYLGAIGIDPQAPTTEHYYHRMSAERFLDQGPGYVTDITYARWFLHAVEEEVEDQLLEWTQGQLLVEARAECDDQLDNTHWRRPINTTKFLEKLIRLNYHITYFEIGRGFSPPGHPLLFRVDAMRKTSAT